jgi:hypothetical protein
MAQYQSSPSPTPFQPVQEKEEVAAVNRGRYKKNLIVPAKERHFRNKSPTSNVILLATGDTALNGK